MNKVAYAVGFIDTRETPPVVKSFGIFSSCAKGLTTDQVKLFAFDVASFSGTDYEDACSKLKAYLAEFFPWVQKVYAGSLTE